ncbi:FKBP-type peptidyl-prolyl cis-trans isomerase [Jiulongibacter sp. NS-SX5]|uniref:FKBP-type peptidyl-prolyl cis-trans isomerase n=1 Tax=Jiulongibacter sp. NS-SX5 TaxID=3463854 RepID=UPI00405897DF
MKKKLVALTVLLSLTQFFKTQAQTTLGSEQDSLSYAIGVSVAQSLKAQNVKPDLDILSAAINDVLEGNELEFGLQQCGMFIQNYFQKKAGEVAAANQKIGEEFLTKNKAREGVMETASGLQYEVLTAGEGAKPQLSDKVKVHYHGTLIDGTVFDSSVERGSPTTFGLTQVIKGWTEALQLMPEGSKYRLYIPADLAYGPRGQGKIAPNSALIFDVELLEIVK